MKTNGSFMFLIIILFAVSIIYVTGCGSNATGGGSGGSSGGGASWHFITVESGADSLGYSSLVFDNNGNPSIAYCNYDFVNTYKFATIDATTLTVRVCTVDVDALNNGVSLAFNGTNVPYLAYASGDGTKMASMGATGIWITTDINLADHLLNNGISLGISGGTVYISYSCFNSPYQLRLATILNGTIPAISTVKDVTTPQYSSLAIMANGYPAIAFANTGTVKSVGYNYFTDMALGVQVTSEIAASNPTYTSLKLDSSGRARIAYINDNNNLMYAEWNSTGSVWDVTTVTVESSAAILQHSSLALTSTGDPMIAYYNDVSESLKLARRSGTTWTIETINSATTTGGGETVGEYCSLALDSSDRPCISYIDRVHTMKYAYWR
jgi:hypothetical protein